MFKDLITCYSKINEIYKFRTYSFKKTFMHLLLLTLIFGSLQGYSKTRIINQEFNYIINNMSSWNFRIQDGNFLIEDAPKELHINNFIIYFPKDNETPNFDTNNIYVIIKNNNIETYIDGSKTDFPIISIGTLTKDEFLGSLHSARIFYDVFNFILTLILFFLGKIIAAYFIAALLNNSITSRILSYKFSDLFKLSFYVMTIAVTVQSILFAFGFDILISMFASSIFVFISSLMLRMVLQYEFKITNNN